MSRPTETSDAKLHISTVASTPLSPVAPGIRHGEVTLYGDPIMYREVGTYDPARPTILLLHGISSASITWEPILLLLAKAGVHAIAPDLLGHGDSAKPRGDYSLGAQATSLRDLCATLGIRKVTVVGHSLGGGVAMMFTYQFPVLVGRMALVSAGGLGPDVSFILRAATLPLANVVMPVIAERHLVKGVQGFGRWLRKMGAPPAPELAEQIACWASLSDPAQRRVFIRTATSVIDPHGQSVDARNRLRLASTVPTLIVWGRRDRIIPVKHGEEAASIIPGARLEVFEHAGHFPYVDDPYRFVEVLLDWVNGTTEADLDEEHLLDRLQAAGLDPREAVGA